jgi:hypothetical protein
MRTVRRERVLRHRLSMQASSVPAITALTISGADAAQASSRGAMARRGH